MKQSSLEGFQFMSLFSLPAIQTDLWELAGMSRIGRVQTSTILQHELHRQADRDILGRA